MAMTPDQIKKLATGALEAQDAADRAASSLQGLIQGTAAYEQQLTAALRAQADASQSTLQYAREAKKGATAVGALKGEVVAANQAYNQHVASLQSAADALALYNKQAAIGYDATKNLAQQIGLMGDDWQTASSSIFMTKGGLEGMGKAFGEIINPMNLAGSVMNSFIEGTIELTLAADQAYVSLNKQTGMAGQFKDQIAASEDKLRSSGVLIGDLANSYGGLATELGTFTDMSKTDQSSMADGIALLDKYGISADQTIGTMATMTATMGMTGPEAVNMQKSLFLTAQENNISTGKMMADFAAVSDELAALGDGAVEAFGDLAMSAKKSNMEVSGLLGITEQFDTFEGAAKSVGSLNALLGGPYLNSLQMVMETDPTARMKQLQGALTDSGKAFNDMSYYERKAIADAAGLQSVTDLAKVMKGDFEGMAGAVAKTDEELMALDEQSASFNTLMEKVKQTLMLFATELEPVVTFVKGLLDKFQKMNPETKKMIVGMAAAAVGAKLLGSFFSKSAEATQSQAEANKGTASTLAVYTSALWDAVKIGLIAIPVFYAIKAAASAIGKAFAGAGDMSAMFESLDNINVLSFAKAAVGISQISTALNKLEDGKAIQVSTVFDSAAAMTATQNINTASAATTQMSANGASQAGPLTAQIDLTTKFEIDGREIKEVVTRHSPVLQWANTAARG